MAEVTTASINGPAPGFNAPGATPTPAPVVPAPAAPAPAPANLPNDPLKLPDAPPAAIITDADVDALQAEYVKDGKLSDATLDALEKKGIPKRFVEQYVKGGEALNKQTVDSLYAEVGGKANFDQMRAWAASLPQAERDAYESAVKTGNANVVALAVRGLYSKYTAANGTLPNLNPGVGRGPSGPAPFQSRAQLVAAIRDPKYASDPAFRREVEARVAATQEFSA